MRPDKEMKMRIDVLCLDVKFVARYYNVKMKRCDPTEKHFCVKAKDLRIFRASKKESERA